MIASTTTVVSEFTLTLYEGANFAEAEKRVKDNLEDARIISIEVEEERYKGVLTNSNYKIKAEHTLFI